MSRVYLSTVVKVSILLNKNYLVISLVCLLSACGGGSSPTTSDATSAAQEAADKAAQDLIDQEAADKAAQEIIDTAEDAAEEAANEAINAAATAKKSATDATSAATPELAYAAATAASEAAKIASDAVEVATTAAEIAGTETATELVAAAEKAASEAIESANSAQETAESLELAENGFIAILPSESGIELQDWYLSIPVDEGDGFATSIDEDTLVDGYTNSDFFYGIQEADGDKGIVMKSPARGYRTSAGTYYTRVELREMLIRGDSGSTKDADNNWVFSTAPTEVQDAAGGIDGELNVTMAVNHVTTTYGEDLTQVKASDQSKTKEQFEYQVGRVVIGQIHGSKDEPIRLYYRKLPDHDLGSVYFWHEPRDLDTDDEIDVPEVLVELLGSEDLDIGDDEPTDGIALNEKFSYTINVTANLLTVTISRDGKDDVVKSLDMSTSGLNGETSGFELADEWHYFKAGIYHLNNTASDEDYVQATFYEIRNSHTGYNESE